jgi:hypothetical protein
MHIMALSRAFTWHLPFTNQRTIVRGCLFVNHCSNVIRSLATGSEKQTAKERKQKRLEQRAALKKARHLQHLQSMKKKQKRARSAKWHAVRQRKKLRRNLPEKKKPEPEDSKLFALRTRVFIFSNDHHRVGKDKLLSNPQFSQTRDAAFESHKKAIEVLEEEEKSSHLQELELQKIIMHIAGRHFKKGSQDWNNWVVPAFREVLDMLDSLKYVPLNVIGEVRNRFISEKKRKLTYLWHRFEKYENRIDYCHSVFNFRRGSEKQLILSIREQVVRGHVERAIEIFVGSKMEKVHTTERYAALINECFLTSPMSKKFSIDLFNDAFFRDVQLNPKTVALLASYKPNIAWEDPQVVSIMALKELGLVSPTKPEFHRYLSKLIPDQSPRRNQSIGQSSFKSFLLGKRIDTYERKRQQRIHSLITNWFSESCIGQFLLEERMEDAVRVFLQNLSTDLSVFGKHYEFLASKLKGPEHMNLAASLLNDMFYKKIFPDRVTLSHFVRCVKKKSEEDDDLQAPLLIKDVLQLTDNPDMNLENADFLCFLTEDSGLKYREVFWLLVHLDSIGVVPSTRVLSRCFQYVLEENDPQVVVIFLDFLQNKNWPLPSGIFEQALKLCALASDAERALEVVKLADKAEVQTDFLKSAKKSFARYYSNQRTRSVTAFRKFKEFGDQKTKTS